MNIISIYVRISVCKIVDLHGPRDEVPSFAVHQIWSVFKCGSQREYF